MNVQTDNLKIITDRDRETWHCHHYPKLPKKVRYKDENIFYSPKTGVVESLSNIKTLEGFSKSLQNGHIYCVYTVHIYI